MILIFRRVESFEEIFRASNLYGDFAAIYHQTHFRASPWIIGIMVGFFIHNHEKIQIHKVRQTFFHLSNNKSSIDFR